MGSRVKFVTRKDLMKTLNIKIENRKIFSFIANVKKNMLIEFFSGYPL